MRCRGLLFLTIIVAVATAHRCDAGSVTLKNGTVLEGQLVPIQGMTERLIRQQSGSADEIVSYPILMVDAGYKRYFVGNRQVATADRGEKLARDDVFFLKKNVSGKDLGLASIGLPLRVTPFDRYGVRTVTLRTSRGTTDVVQGVTQLAPTFLTVEGITGLWWQGLPTKAMPADQLAAMLHTAIKQKNPDDRMAVARFYLQAGLYDAAAVELAGIGRDFPEMAARVAELDRDLRQLRAVGLLAELRRRRAAGQHRLATAVAAAFPTEAGFDAEVLRQVTALRTAEVTAREQADHALLLLGELEAQVSDAAQREVVAALRPIVRRQLDYDTLPGSMPFSHSPPMPR